MHREKSIGDIVLPRRHFELNLIVITNDVIFGKYVGDIRKWRTLGKHFPIGMSTLGLMNWLQIKLTAKYAENLTTCFTQILRNM